MKMHMYTILNDKSKLHDGVMLFRTHDDATYTLSTQVPESRQSISTICHIADFDIETGHVYTIDQIEFLDWLQKSPEAISQAPTDFKPAPAGSPADIERQFINRTSQKTSRTT